MKPTDMHRKWALAGATGRLQEIQAEAAAIYRAFPELKRKGGSAGTATGLKRQFSEKGKEAISEGMRKYWARRKAAEAKGAKATKG